MFDDDKMNHTPENKDTDKVVDAAETAADDAPEKLDEAKEAPLGKVIPFNPDFEPKAAVDTMNAALEDVVNNLRTAFSELGKQLAPLREGLKEVSVVLKDSAKELKKSAEVAAEAIKTAETDGANAEEVTEEAKADKAVEDAASETKAETKPEFEEGSAAAAIRDASDAVAQGIGKMKDRMANTKFDFKGAVSREFESFADAKLKDEDYTIDENGKRVVKVDGKFFQNYGNDVVPALIRGTIGSFLKTLMGEDVMAEADKADKTDSEDKNDSETAEAEVVTEEAKTEETADTQTDSKYRVQFDFSNAFADLLKNAKVSPEVSEKIEERQLDVSRAALIEGGRIVEDVLNGKGTGNIEERVGKAMDEAAKDDSEKAPEDIKAVDEKHKRILELAQQYEHNMNPDND